MSCHFGLLRLDFLSFLPFRRCRVWPKPIFLLPRLVASSQFHLQTTLGRNRFFGWPALRHQPGSILKRPLAETDVLLARFVALGNMHPRTTLGRNRIFCWPALWRRAISSSNDPGPKPIFCWPALWHHSSPGLSTSPGRHRCLSGPSCDIYPIPSSNGPWPKPMFCSPCSRVAWGMLRFQTTLGRNRFFCWPALWHQPSSILKRPLAETDVLLARFVAPGNIHLQTTLG